MNKKKEKLFVLVGPTASGKTDVSIRLAQYFDAEIISADSVQIYEQLNIGSAKPEKEQLLAVKHHMIGEIPLTEDFSVSQYQNLAFQAIEEVLAKGKRAFVVGGTGFYVQALTKVMRFSDAAKDEAFRQSWYDKESIEPHSAHRALQKIDPATAERLHPNDQKRVIRALEVYQLSGKRLSESVDEDQEGPYDNIMAGIIMPRELLNERINLRVDLMMKAGLIEEVEGILKDGYDPSLNALQGIGYKEVIAALQGRMSMEEATELIKQSTRQFAKRQWVWFKKDKRIKWFDRTEYKDDERLYDAIKQYYEAEREGE